MRFKDDMTFSDLSIKLTGITLPNPTILAAGILGTTGASLRRIARSGAGAVITKSLGTRVEQGHHNPSLIELEYGLLNAMGLPNPSYKGFRDELSAAKEGNVPVIVSIFGSHPEEFTEIISGLEGADAYELNLSCPHAEIYDAAVGTDPVLVEEITRAAKTAASVPVWVKLSANVTDIVMIGKAASRGGADAVVAINTIRGMVIDIHSGYPVLGNVYGGISGAAIHPVAVKCVYDLYSALDIPIIGVGGVSNWKDTIEMIMAGASAVQIGSAVYDNVNIFKEINDDLLEFFINSDWDLKTIIGLTHRKVEQ
jgi:dihydroorotate dehydrogenase (NAD+) catalytic subunit